MAKIKQLRGRASFCTQSDSSACSMLLWVFIGKYEACFTKAGRITNDKQLWNGSNYRIIEWFFSECGQSPVLIQLTFCVNKH